MNWVLDNWKILFGGVAGTALVAMIGYFLKRMMEPKTQPSGQLTAQGAKVSASPVASGKDINQSVIETQHIHYYKEAAKLEDQVKPPLAKSQEPKPNITYVRTETLVIKEVDSMVFFVWKDGFPAVLIRFSNDAVRGASTKPALVKAAIIYHVHDNEILRVIGSWLEHNSGERYFEVDSSYMLILCFVFQDELSTLKKVSHYAHRRTFWQTELLKFNGVEKFTALVRLTSPTSGYCYFEGEFEVQKNPFTVSLKKST